MRQIVPLETCRKCKYIQVLIDCHAGLNTTVRLSVSLSMGIPCRQTERNWIGIEIAEGNLEIAARRLHREIS